MPNQPTHQIQKLHKLYLHATLEAYFSRLHVNRNMIMSWIFEVHKRQISLRCLKASDKFPTLYCCQADHHSTSISCRKTTQSRPTWFICKLVRKWQSYPESFQEARSPQSQHPPDSLWYITVPPTNKRSVNWSPRWQELQEDQDKNWQRNVVMIKITIVMLPMISALETVHTYCTATPNQDLLLTCNLKTWGLHNQGILATIRPTCTCHDATPKHRKTVLLQGLRVFLRNSEKGTMQSTSNDHHDQELVVNTGNSTWDIPEVYNKLLSNLYFHD